MTINCPHCGHLLSSDDLCWLPNDHLPKLQEEQIAYYYYCCNCTRTIKIACP